MKTISIIGSCQSRDIFNSHFIPDYKKEFTVYSYYTMTSMLSVMGKAVGYHYPNLMKSGMNDVQKEHWYYELEKPVLVTLRAKKPDILLLDFYADARYGAVQYQDSYIVNRYERIKKRDVICLEELQVVYDFEKKQKEFLERWKEAVDEFFMFLGEYLPETKIVLNTVKGTKVICDQDGNKYINPKIRNLNVDEINQIWEKMDAYVLENYQVTPLLYNRQYYLDKEYKFGLGVALVHFHPEYYRDCYEKLLEATKGIQEKIVFDTVNLIEEHMFQFGSKHCYQQKGDFRIKKEADTVVISPVDCHTALGEYRPHIWSKPIEVLGNGKARYKLSFSIEVEDLSCVPEELTVFAIRTFKRVWEVTYKECLDEYIIRIQKANLECNRKHKVELEFVSHGKYVKLAPFLMQYIPGITYSEIQLQRVK